MLLAVEQDTECRRSINGTDFNGGIEKVRKLEVREMIRQAKLLGIKKGMW